MKVLGDIDQLPRGLRFVLAIGVFDGVHRGHQRVIGSLTKAARDLKATPVVMTFDQHPAAVLRGSPPTLLCDPAERLALLARSGVGITIVQRFDRAFADLPPEDFLRRAASGRSIAALVMTAESAFGRDRAGGLPAVRRLAGDFGYRVIEVPRAARSGETLSSTRLRGLVTAGRLSEARRELGRAYAVIGTVVAGDRRGRELGYPTANLAFDTAVALPPDGVYAVHATWGGTDPLSAARTANGVASLGVRPTFGSGGDRVLEVHLFDVDEDLYGVRLRVEFVRRLRGEKRFATAAALVKQMDRDTTRARDILAKVRQTR